MSERLCLNTPTQDESPPRQDKDKDKDSETQAEVLAEVKPLSEDELELSIEKELAQLEASLKNDHEESV